jgi:predicted nucleotidyltransferase
MPHCLEHEDQPVSERQLLKDRRSRIGGDEVTGEDVLAMLAQSRPDLDRFHVTSLSIFGSVARDEASADSDVDVLVEFDPEAVVGLFEFVRLQRYLTQLLGRRVDLATPDALHKALRESILSEAIRAA